MTLYCNYCVTHAVHENALEPVFIKDGTSWCMPHYVDHLEATKEADRQLARIRNEVWRSTYLSPYSRRR